MLTRFAAVLMLLNATAALAVSNQANFNDGKDGSPMQCRTFVDDPQGAKCAKFCQDLKRADKEGQTYCMCLPGPCPKAR